VQERNRCHPVLQQIEAAVQVLVQRDWYCTADVDLLGTALTRQVGCRWCARQEQAVRSLSPRATWQVCRALRGDADLASLSGVLSGDRRRHVGTGEQEGALDVPCEKQVESTRVHTDADAKAHLADTGVAASELPHPRPQRVGGAGGSACVLVTGEQDEEGVSSEAEQLSARLVGDGDQLGEDAVDNVGELLGAFSSEPRQALGQGREAAQVGEEE
jgi:hypothetical protein